MKKGHLNIAFPWVWSLPVKYQAKNVHVNSPGDLGELVRWPREKSSPPPPPSPQICYCSFDLGFMVHSVLNSMLSREKQSFYSVDQVKQKISILFSSLFFLPCFVQLSQLLGLFAAKYQPNRTKYSYLVASQSCF